MDWVDKPQNYKDLYGILQLLRLSHLNNFPLKTLKPGWVAFHSVTFQLKFLDFQSNQYKNLVPVLSRFCNGLYCSSVEFEQGLLKSSYWTCRVFSAFFCGRVISRRLCECRAHGLCRFVIQLLDNMIGIFLTSLLYLQFYIFNTYTRTKKVPILNLEAK